MISYINALRIKNCYYLIKEYESSKPQSINNVFRKNITQSSTEKMVQYNSNISTSYHHIFGDNSFDEGFFVGASTMAGLISVSFISICALKHLYRKCKDINHSPSNNKYHHISSPIIDDGIPLIEEERPLDNSSTTSENTYAFMEPKYSNMEWDNSDGVYIEMTTNV